MRPDARSPGKLARTHATLFDRRASRSVTTFGFALVFLPTPSCVLVLVGRMANSVFIRAFSAAVISGERLPFAASLGSPLPREVLKTESANDSDPCAVEGQRRVRRRPPQPDVPARAQACEGGRARELLRAGSPNLWYPNAAPSWTERCLAWPMSCLSRPRRLTCSRGGRREHLCSPPLCRKWRPSLQLEPRLASS